MKLHFLALFLSICALSQAQTITVLDSSLNPLSSVEILDSNQQLGFTDSLGQFDLPEGNLSGKRFIFRSRSLFYYSKTYEELQRSNFQLILKPNIFNIPFVEFGFERDKRGRNDIGTNITSIEAKDIELSQPQTSADLLGSQQKVYIQKSQLGGGSPMIRGFATNKILIVVDDVRFNTAIFRSGNVHNIISIDPLSVHEAEVILGPSSQFYGSDAIGGVLNFTTKNKPLGDSTMGGSALYRFGSANKETTMHVDFGFGTGKFSSFSSFSTSQFSDLRMGSNGPDEYLRPDMVSERTGMPDTIIDNPNPQIQYYSGYSQVNLMQKFNYQFRPKLAFNYSFYMAQSSDIPRYDRQLLRDGNDSLRYAQWLYGPQKWQMHRLQFEDLNVNRFYQQLKFTTAYMRMEESRKDRRFGSEILRQREEVVDAFSVNLDLYKRYDSGFRLHYGAEWVSNLVGSNGQSIHINTGERTTIASRYADGSQWNSAGIYVNGYKRIRSWYKLEGGLRFNHFGIAGQLDTQFYKFKDLDLEASNNALTYSLAQLFTFNNIQLGWINSSAFRAPNIDDVSKVFDSNPGNVILPNPDLGPEVAYSSEINVKSHYRFFNFDVSAYYTYLDEAIGLSSGSDSILYDGLLSRTQMLTNTDNAQVYGLQLGMELILNKIFKLRSTYNWIDSRSSDGLPIRHITPNYGGTHLFVDYKRVRLDAYAVYHQTLSQDQFPLAELGDAYLYPKDENGKIYSPAWYTINLKAHIAVTSKTSLNVGIENILDKRYRPFASGITASGVNFSVAASVKF